MQFLERVVQPKKLLAVGGEAEVPRVSSQERRAELALERPDQLRYGRRAHVELTRGRREAAGLDHPDEVLHSAQPIHGRPPLVKRCLILA
jgi:hypothetical protein